MATKPKIQTRKLIVCVMGQNCERFIKMCLESAKNADAIIYCDGGSTDKTLDIVKLYSATIIQQNYDQEDIGMNGKQRNFYLNYLKKNYPNDWALCLDADEIVEDLNKIKEFIKSAKPALYSVKMRHLIGDLAHEDATVETHFVPNRLFKISEADHYPEVEHSVLIPKKGSEQLAYAGTTIWHLAYIPNMWEIKRRYDNHVKKSSIHTPEFLRQWYFWHLFGTYPKKEFDPEELPEILLNEFGINKDELYFARRGIEFKHPLMVKQWYDYFKPKNVLDLGCGRGPYLYFWNWFVEDIHGIDISEYAVKTSFIPDKISQGDITDETVYKKTDLITAIDVLEHLDDDQLNKALSNISKYGKRFLFSIPFIGDANLYKDRTHKQFRTKEEWIKLIESYGIKIVPTPEHWFFKDQILIGIKEIK